MGQIPIDPHFRTLTEITVSRGRIGWWYAQRVQDRLGSRRRCSRVDDTCELFAGSDTMVGGQHHHHHISKALTTDQCPQADGCRGVATHGLADDVGVRQIRKLFSNEWNEGFVREHEDPFGRSDQGSQAITRLQQAPVTEQGEELLGLVLGAEGPESRARSSGQHHYRAVRSAVATCAGRRPCGDVDGCGVIFTGVFHCCQGLRCASEQRCVTSSPVACSAPC